MTMAESLEVSDDIQEAYLALLERGWTDGLPVIPATPERVDAMLGDWEGDPDEALGLVPPRMGELTPRVCAINAVMAGCTRTHLPLMVSALRAMLDPVFNLHGMQTTTHPVGACIIFSGPRAREAGVHSGSGCFGPGFHANAVIGRAVRLVLLNVGGAAPGTVDKATFGTPAKYTLCFADRAEDNPWPTIAEEWTGSRSGSTVTVVPTEGPHNVNDHYSTTGFGVLTMVAHSLATIGSNDPYYPDSTPVVVLSPEHAANVIAEGYSRQDVKEFLVHHARVELRKWSLENQDGRFRSKWPRLYKFADKDVTIPVIGSADKVILAVAGGAGKHSMVIPTVGIGAAVTTVCR